MPTTRSALILVALLVALAGCGGADDASGDAGGDGAQQASGAVEVGADDLVFDPEQLTAQAGTVKVIVNNVGAVEHDFVVEEANDTEVARAAPGGTDEGTIDLEAGSYTFYCSIPGHREAGMEGTLEVE